MLEHKCCICYHHHHHFHNYHNRSNHHNFLGCLALNSEGSLVATASILGTIIRIFKTSDGRCMHELRMSSVPHDVRSIAIRGDNKFLAATSSSMYVSIFQLGDKINFSTSANGN